jgi:hypothetical protein
VAVFDDILNAVPEEEKTNFEERFPQIRESVEALETRNQELQSQVEEAETKVQAWNTWRQDNWDTEAEMTHTEAGLRSQVTDLEQRNAELQEGAETEMTFDEILTGLKEKGVVTKEELDQKLKDAGGLSPADAQAIVNQQAIGTEAFYGKTYGIGFKHMKEFDEVLEMDTLLDYMREKKEFDPQAAYDKMVAGRREEMATAKATADEEARKAELEAAEEKGRKQALQETTMRNGGQLPTDQAGSNDKIGHLQRSKLESAKAGSEGEKAVPDGVQLGTGQLAHLGFEELQKSRSGGVN